VVPVSFFILALIPYISSVIKPNPMSNFSFFSTEKALENALDHFSAEFEMIGSLVVLPEKSIAREWGVSLDIAKEMKAEAIETHRNFVIAIQKVQDELKKVKAVNQKYWV
jgi:hypothetical protein